MNKIKYFVFSDVHGEYDALMNSLRDAGYDNSNPQHQLISIGDAFDRGPHSKKIFNFLRQNHAICVKGNHDEFFEEYLEKGMDGEFVLFNILHNGLGETIHSFTGLPDNMFDPKTVDRARVNVDPYVLSWLKNMPLYYETQHFIFCHAGLDPNQRNWKDTDRHFMLWDIEDSHVPINSTDKIVMIGHHHAFRVKKNAEAVGFTHSSLDDTRLRIVEPNGNVSQTPIRCYGNTDEHSPYCYGNKVAIDGCVNLTKKVNVVVFEDYPLEEEKKPDKGKEPDPNIVSDGTTSYAYTIHNDDIYVNYANAFAQAGVTVNEAMANIAGYATGRFTTTTR